MKDNKYFVLCAKEALKSETYRTMKRFDSVDSAAEFAISHLHSEPLLARLLPASRQDYAMAKSEDKPYIAVVGVNNSSYDERGGDSYSWKEYKVARCDAKGLEEAIVKLSKQSASSLHLGLELKIMDFLARKVESLTKPTEDE